MWILDPAAIPGARAETDAAAAPDNESSTPSAAPIDESTASATFVDAFASLKPPSSADSTGLSW